ncbi:MAG: hypothetical protein WBE37_29915 [Bryobacteraceae bacterium]
MVTPASEKGMLLASLPRSAGFQAYEKVAILFDMEILGYAVHELKCQDVAAQFRRVALAESWRRWQQT